MSNKTSDGRTNWYVVYTYPKCERKANKKLKDLGITTFLPMQKVVRQWSDRKKKIEVPLFPNYIFINVLPHERFNALKVRELVRYVSFARKPAIIPQEVINSIRKVLNGEVDVSNECFNKVGVEVTISRGRFSGAKGVLIRKNGKYRLIVYLETLNSELSVDVPASDVEMTPNKALN